MGAEPPEDAWLRITFELPHNGKVVWTKVDDGNGVRNVQKLRRNGNLWFMPDGSMYVYYTPTHYVPQQ